MAESSQDQSKDAPAEASTGKWSRLHLWEIQGVRDVLVILGVFALFWLGQKVSVVTVPVLLAILFAYLFEPVICWLTKKTSLKRTGAVIAIIATTIAVVVIPSILGLTYGVVQGVGLAGRASENIKLVSQYVKADEPRTLPALPEAAESSEGDAEVDFTTPGEPAEIGDPEADDSDAEPAAGAGGQDGARSSIKLKQARARLKEAGSAWLWIGDQIRDGEDSGFAQAFDAVDTWLDNNAERVAQTAAAAGVGVVQTALGFLASAFSLMFMAFLTVFFFFFFATGWVNFKGFTGQLLPDKNRDLIIDLATKFDRVISAFIRGRLTIAFIQSIVFTIGFWLIGVPASFILGPAVALLSIVPYLALVGVPVAIVLLWLEAHTGLRGHVLWILGAPLAFYFFAQALDDYVWTPLIQGKSTDMSTPMILFASIAGGVLFGVFGLLIAIPIAACLKILIQEIFWPRFQDWAEGRASDVLPIE